MDEPIKINEIKQPGESLYKDKGSKHFGLVFPIFSEELAKEKIQEIKAQHSKANHHCFAYIINQGNLIVERYNDDGEPSNSAGLPIFNQLKKVELQNVLAVVVRYFGGTKLGVGGLINAYRTATELALKNTEIISKIPTKNFIIKVSFDEISTVNQILNQNRISILKEEYTNNYAIFVELEYHLENWFKSLFELVPNKKIEEI